MALLPNRNVVDGSKTPATTVAEMKSALGAMRDYLADLLGLDSTDKTAARTALGAAGVVDMQAGKAISAVATGTADALAISLSPAVVVLVDLMEFHVRCKGPNTLVAPTLTIDALPALTIVAADGGALPVGAYVDNWPATFRYRASTGKVELLNPVPIIGTGKSLVRQTALSGLLDSSGYANFLTVGSGLSVNLTASSVPLLLSFAAGHDATGEVNYLARLTSNVSGIVSGLAASNVSYIYADYVSPTSVTWGKTLAPLQTGNSYNKVAQSCVSLNNLSTDDFGNVWTNTGITFSNSSPAISGTYMGVFNGTGANLRSLAFTTLGPGSWTKRIKFKPAAVAASVLLISAGNTSGYGVYLGHASGKLNLYLSSTGSSWDLANGLVGNTTLVNGTSYDLEISFDAVVGKYFVWLNGFVESNLTTTSTARICAMNNVTLGAYSTSTPTNFFTGSMQAFEYLPYCLHPNGVSFTVPTTLADITAAGYASDFYSLADTKTYQVTASSTVAGVSPTMTAKNRLHLGEVVTGTVAVANVVTYALRKKYVSPVNPMPSNGAWAVLNSNVGTTAARISAILICIDNDDAYAPGDIIPLYTATNGSAAFNAALAITGRNTCQVGNNANPTIQSHKTSTSGNLLTTSKWAVQVTVEGVS